jgi:hypothetical protein
MSHPQVCSARTVFLLSAYSLCSYFVHVRRGPYCHLSREPRPTRGWHGHAHSHRLRPPSRAQADRLRQASRRHGSAACICARFRPFRPTLRHDRSRGHLGSHHAWPAPRRGTGNQAVPPRRTRPTPRVETLPHLPYARAAPRSAAGHATCRPSQEPHHGSAPREPSDGRRDRRRGAASADRRSHRDICGDLGIAPGQLDRAFWEEISHAIIMYGGSLSRFLRNLHTGLCAFGRPDGSDDAVPGWAAAPPLLSAPSTGPP